MRLDIRTPTYKRPRFPTDIIRYVVWLHFRFKLCGRDFEVMFPQQTGPTILRISGTRDVFLSTWPRDGGKVRDRILMSVTGREQV
jgi:hypothetical protein